MADEQDQAEQLDEDKHSPEFPPDEPLGVDDPTRDDRIEDDYETRDARHEPLPADRDLAEDERPLVQPFVSAEQAAIDDETDLVAEAMIDERGPYSDAAAPAAEEVALHLED